MTLDQTISPGDPGHIQTHEDIATILDSLDDALTSGWRATGWKQGLLAARPLALPVYTGLFYFATDVPALYYCDGTSWHEQHLAAASNTWTGINNFEGDVFFKSGRPWADVMSDDYGAAGDGVTNDSPAFASAITDLDTLGGGILFMPPPDVSYRWTSAVVLQENITVMGSGRNGCLIQTAGAINGFTYAPASLTEANIDLHNFTIRGTTASGLVVLLFTNAVGVTMNCVNARNSSTAVCQFTTCHNVKIDSCRIEDWTTYGVALLTGANNNTLINCDFQMNGTQSTGTSAALLISASGEINVLGCNLEGASQDGSGIMLSGANDVNIIGGFIELWGASAIVANTTLSFNIVIQGVNVNSAFNSIVIDFSVSSLVHRNIVLTNVRCGAFVAAGSLFAPGSASSFRATFDVAGATNEPAAPVVGYVGTTGSTIVKGDHLIDGALSTYGSVTANADAVASIQTITGPTGPSNEAGIRLGGDFDIYRAGADHAKIGSGDTFDTTDGYAKFVRVTTAGLSAGAANFDGVILIEDAGAGAGHLVFYKGSQRFRCTGALF